MSRQEFWRSWHQQQEERRKNWNTDFPGLFPEGKHVEISHPLGWEQIVENLCAELLTIGDPNLYITQTKQKLSHLRVYLSHYQNDLANEAVGRAYRSSLVTCEDCGGSKEVAPRQGGWVKRQCVECADGVPVLPKGTIFGS